MGGTRWGTGLIVSALALASAGTAFAATPTGAGNSSAMIVVDTAAAWTHAPTGLVLPPELDGFTRTSVSQNGQNFVDVTIGYADSAQSTTLTVYIFRAGWPQAPLWTDRLTMGMTSTIERLGGKPDSAPTYTPFTPQGHASASALRVVQAIKGGPMRSTGAVVIPAGKWLFTMRMSSDKLDAAALDARLAQVAQAFAVPVPVQPLPPALPLVDCTDRLTLPKASHGEPWDRHGILTGAVLAKTEESPSKIPLGPDPLTTRLCRDAGSTRQFGIYRQPDSKSGYVIGLGDAGVTLEVRPSVIAQIFNKGPRFDLVLSAFDKTLIFPSYVAVPAPEQAIEALSQEKPEASFDDTHKVTLFE